MAHLSIKIMTTEKGVTSSSASPIEFWQITVMTIILPLRL